MSNVLVFSVHPDDETLGCGGTLLKHKKILKDDIYCIFVTDGNNSQRKLIPKVSKSFEFKEYYRMNFQETFLDKISISEIISKFTEVLKKVTPEIVYIPNRSDVHSDHRVVFDAIISSTKSFRAPYIKKILMCEVPSETDFTPALNENAFLPNVFVDISETFNEKFEIFKIFSSEILPEPFTRSLSTIKALARYRGSQINVMYAEAFMLIKEII